MALRAPKGLGASGRRLWRDVTGTYELRVDEQRLLEDACREVDLIDRMEAEMAKPDASLTARGSMGQTVAAPLIAEVRQHRTVLRALLQSLKLPEIDAKGQTPAKPRATSAREAAMTRWGQRGA